MTRARVQKFQQLSQKTLEELFPSEIYWNEEWITVTFVGGKGEQDQVDGGFEEQADCSFRVDKTLMTTPPDVREVIRARMPDGTEKRYRVIAVPPRPHETAHYIACQDPDQ